MWTGPKYSNIRIVGNAARTERQLKILNCDGVGFGPDRTAACGNNIITLEHIESSDMLRACNAMRDAALMPCLSLLQIVAMTTALFVILRLVVSNVEVPELVHKAVLV